MGILLVEDEPNVVSVVKRGLTDYGFEVSVAANGATGLQMALDHDFDLIILDVMLPVMDGIQVCKHIRQQKKMIPIIMLTALNSTENIVSALDSWADDYMVKPFKIAELAARFRTLLRRSGSETSANNTYAIGNLVLNTE
jgi:two-component system copper resistance phosphate regulon response regulator CusR